MSRISSLDALIFLRGEFLRVWGAFSKSSTSGRNTGRFLHPPYSAEALYSFSFFREMRRLSYTPFAGDRKTIRIRKMASAVILKSPNEYSYRDRMMIHRFQNQIGKACALAAATLILPVLALAQTAPTTSTVRPIAHIPDRRWGAWSSVIDCYL
jgi:hypothetical protein